MENKETAAIVYGGMAFVLTAIVNFVALRKKYTVLTGLLSFTLNLISGSILAYYLIYSVQFNMVGGRFPILLLIIIAIEIIIIGIVIGTDLKQLFKNWL